MTGRRVLIAATTTLAGLALAAAAVVRAVWVIEHAWDGWPE